MLLQLESGRQERWRYKRTPIEEWAPRRRALNLDVLSNLSTARREALEQTDLYSRNAEFEELPQSLLHKDDYRVVLKGRWEA